MKSLLAAAVLLSVSMSASAQKYGVAAAYEYDSATQNKIGLESLAKKGFLVGTRGKYGTVDLDFYEVALKGTTVADNIKGIEFGYAPPVLPVGPVQLSARLAIGHLSNRGLGNPPTANYRTLGITASYPLSKQFSPFVSFRYRPEQDLERQSMYSIGATYLMSKNVMLQATVRQTRSSKLPIMNGFSTQVLFMF
jgi:hypothetical protein